jgi:hypothetical protein
MPGETGRDRLRGREPYLVGTLQDAARMQVHFGNTYYL